MNLIFSQPRNRQDGINMDRRISLLVIYCFAASTVIAQHFLLRGKVVSSGQPMQGASVVVTPGELITITDSTGNFLFFLAKGTYQVSVSFTGFETNRRTVTLTTSKFIEFSMSEHAKELDELVVSDISPEHNIKSLDVGTTRLSMKIIRQMPAFMGEVDLMKSILTLPGVTTVGEGTSSINVRGGSADQNLILIDKAPIFNPAHLMGLVSIFNPDLLDELTFFRGGIPAGYGERVSSVLDISIRNPDLEKWNFQTGIGLISNKVSIDGPIKRGKLAISFGFRLAYPELLFRMSGISLLKNTKASFNDLTGKLIFTPSQKDKFTFTSYNSRDRFKANGDSLSVIEINATSSKFEWFTQTATLQWSHAINQNVQVNSSAILSNYQSTVSSDQEENAFELNSRLRYRSVKSAIEFEPSSWGKIEAGISAIRYDIHPGELFPTSPISNINPNLLPKLQSYENALFFSKELKSGKFSVMTGVRYSYFIDVGPGTIFEYDEHLPKTPASIRDTLVIKPGKPTSSYQGVEPRFSLRYQTGPSSSIKLGYNRSRQYIHQISNTTAAMPVDRWQTSNRYIKPLIGDQISIGYYRNFDGNKLEGSVEAFGKRMQNVTDFKDGANLLLNSAIETAVLQGKGRAVGLELQLKKNQGNLTGWLNYTLSQSLVRIDGGQEETRINNGNWYFSNFDRPHQVNLVGSLSKSKQLNFSFNFTYSTGRPVTYPEDKYYLGNIFVPNYTNRNADRIPDYHRLDLALNYNTSVKRFPKLKSTWSLSFYNVYARKNAYSVFFKPNNQARFQYSKTVNTYKLSIFGTIIPSLSYTLKI